MIRSQRMPARRSLFRKSKEKVEVFLVKSLSRRHQNNPTPSLHHQRLHLLTLIKRT